MPEVQLELQGGHETREGEKEQLDISQKLIYRYWRSRHPDFRDPKDTTIDDEVFFALAEARGLDRSLFRGKGQWGTYRYFPDGDNADRYVDLGFDMSKLEDFNGDYRSPRVRIPIYVEAATNDVDKNFWNNTYEFAVDPTMIDALQKQKDEQDRERRAAEERRQEVYQNDVKNIPSSCYGQGWMKGDADPAIHAFLGAHYGELDASETYVALARVDAAHVRISIAQGEKKSAYDIREVSIA